MNNDNTEPKWWSQGLVLGFIMFILISIIYPLITGEGLVLRNVLIGIPISLIGGLCYGLTVDVLKLRNNK